MAIVTAGALAVPTAAIADPVTDTANPVIAPYTGTVPSAERVVQELPVITAATLRLVTGATGSPPAAGVPSPERVVQELPVIAGATVQIINNTAGTAGGLLPPVPDPFRVVQEIPVIADATVRLVTGAAAGAQQTVEGATGPVPSPERIVQEVPVIAGATVRIVTDTAATATDTAGGAVGTATGAAAGAEQTVEGATGPVPSPERIVQEIPVIADATLRLVTSAPATAEQTVEGFVGPVPSPERVVQEVPVIAGATVQIVNNTAGTAGGLLPPVPDPFRVVQEIPVIADATVRLVTGTAATAEQTVEGVTGPVPSPERIVQEVPVIAGATVRIVTEAVVAATTKPVPDAGERLPELQPVRPEDYPKIALSPSCVIDPLCEGEFVALDQPVSTDLVTNVAPGLAVAVPDDEDVAYLRSFDPTSGLDGAISSAADGGTATTRSTCSNFPAAREGDGAVAHQRLWCLERSFERFLVSKKSGTTGRVRWTARAEGFGTNGDRYMEVEITMVDFMASGSALQARGSLSVDCYDRIGVCVNDDRRTQGFQGWSDTPQKYSFYTLSASGGQGPDNRTSYDFDAIFRYERTGYKSGLTVMGGDTARCDSAPYFATPGCSFPGVTELLVLDLNDPAVAGAARHYYEAQRSGSSSTVPTDSQKSIPGWEGNLRPLHRNWYDTAKQSRATTLKNSNCQYYFPRRAAGTDCDEYPFNKTREAANDRNRDWSIRPVPSGENQNAGSRFNAMLTRKRILHDDDFYVRITRAGRKLD